eukprot:UN04394
MDESWNFCEIRFQKLEIRFSLVENIVIKIQLRK